MWQVVHGEVLLGGARYGTVRHGRYGIVWSGEARPGEAWQAWHGEVKLGSAKQGRVRSGRFGKAVDRSFVSWLACRHDVSGHFFQAQSPVRGLADACARAAWLGASSGSEMQAAPRRADLPGAFCVKGMNIRETGLTDPVTLVR